MGPVTALPGPSTHSPHPVSDAAVTHIKSETLRTAVSPRTMQSIRRQSRYVTLAEKSETAILIVRICKTPESICTIFGALQRHFILNTPINSKFFSYIL